MYVCETLTHFLTDTGLHQCLNVAAPVGAHHFFVVFVLSMSSNKSNTLYHYVVFLFYCYPLFKSVMCLILDCKCMEEESNANLK